MKIAYTISGLYNSGGMENILLQKANYLADVLGYDVTIITTDQKDRDVFFPISSNVRVIDLKINYCDAKNTRVWHIIKIIKRKIHKKRLKEILMHEKFDICISLMDFDFSFITSIDDGSKKIAEYHFSRYAKSISAKNNIKKCIQKFRTNLWKSTLRKFDKFIVLTQEDRDQWGNLGNIEVIPNFINSFPKATCDPNANKILSLGRMDFQKGYDMLLDAWEIAEKKIPLWSLSVYGGGDRNKYERIIKERGLKRVSFNPPISPISNIYTSSSLYVMSSRYEGLPLVLLEAMSYGLPIVSFECPCGPKDILQSNFGKLVKANDVQMLAEAIIEAANNKEWRCNAVKAAISHSNLFSKEIIMDKWNNLFKSSV